MPLFPGHIKQKHKRVVINQDAATRSPQSSAQSPSDEIQQLRSQIAQMEQRHTSEIQQLEALWQEQLAIELEPRLDSPITTQTARPRLSLDHIATTYEVPRRLRLKWIERSLGSIPKFLLLVVAGMVLAAVGAIALSPTVLWPSVSTVIVDMVPTLFVIGLFGFFATAVWNVAH